MLGRQMVITSSLTYQTLSHSVQLNCLLTWHCSPRLCSLRLARPTLAHAAPCCHHRIHEHYRYSFLVGIGVSGLMALLTVFMLAETHPPSSRTKFSWVRSNPLGGVWVLAKNPVTLAVMLYQASDLTRVGVGEPLHTTK
jgi:hypothetical protein